MFESARYVRPTLGCITNCKILLRNVKVSLSISILIVYRLNPGHKGVRGLLENLDLAESFISHSRRVPAATCISSLLQTNSITV